MILSLGVTFFSISDSSMSIFFKRSSAKPFPDSYYSLVPVISLGGLSYSSSLLSFSTSSKSFYSFVFFLKLSHRYFLFSNTFFMVNLLFLFSIFIHLLIVLIFMFMIFLFLGCLCCTCFRSINGNLLLYFINILNWFTVWYFFYYFFIFKINFYFFFFWNILFSFCRFIFHYKFCVLKY